MGAGVTGQLQMTERPGCCCGTFRVAGGDVCSEGGRLVLVLVDKRDVAESSVLQAGHTGSERGDARGSAVGVQDSPQPRYKLVQYELRENSSSTCHVSSEHPEGRGARQPHSCRPETYRKWKYSALSAGRPHIARVLGAFDSVSYACFGNTCAAHMYLPDDRGGFRE